MSGHRPAEACVEIGDYVFGFVHPAGAAVGLLDAQTGDIDCSAAAVKLLAGLAMLPLDPTLPLSKQGPPTARMLSASLQGCIHSVSLFRRPHTRCLL